MWLVLGALGADLRGKSVHYWVLLACAGNPVTESLKEFHVRWGRYGNVQPVMGKQTSVMVARLGCCVVMVCGWGDIQVLSVFSDD
jgi:hypothetical protein